MALQANNGHNILICGEFPQYRCNIAHNFKYNGISDIAYICLARVYDVAKLHRL